MPGVKDDDRGLDPGKLYMAPKRSESQTGTDTLPDRYHSAPPVKLKEDLETATLRDIQKYREEFKSHLERRKILLTMHNHQDVIESVQDRLLRIIMTCPKPESGEGLANTTLHSASPDPGRTQLTTGNEATVQTTSPPTSQSQDHAHKDSQDSVHKNGRLKDRQASHTAHNRRVKREDHKLTSTSPPPVSLQIVGQKVKSTRTRRTSIHIQESDSESNESRQQRAGSHGIQSLMDIKKKLYDVNIPSKPPVYVKEKVEVPRTTMYLEIKEGKAHEKFLSPPGPLPKIKAAKRKKEKTAEIRSRYPHVSGIESDKEFYSLVNSYDSDHRSKVLPTYRKINDENDAVTKMAGPPADDNYTKLANDKLPPVHQQNDIENLAKKERRRNPSTLSDGYQKSEYHNLTTITREKEVALHANQKLAPVICPKYNKKMAKNLTSHTTYNDYQKPAKNTRFNDAAKQNPDHPSTSLPPINNLNNMHHAADNRLFLKGRDLPSLNAKPKTLHDFYDKNVGVADGYCLRIPKPTQKVKVVDEPLKEQCKLPAITQKGKKARDGNQRKCR